MLSVHGSRIPLRGGSRNHVCLWTIYPWRPRAVEIRQFGCGAGVWWGSGMCQDMSSSSDSSRAENSGMQELS